MAYFQVTVVAKNMKPCTNFLMGVPQGSVFMANTSFTGANSIIRIPGDPTDYYVADTVPSLITSTNAGSVIPQVKVLPDADYTATVNDLTLILTEPTAVRTFTLSAASSLPNKELNIQCRSLTTGRWMLSGKFVQKGTTGSNPIAENFINSGLVTGTNYRFFSDGNKWYEQ